MFPAELSDQRRDEMIEKAARAVVKRRLESPAVALLEMHKPLAMIGSNLVMFLTPLAAPFISWRRCDELAFFLMDRDNVEKLAGRIEELGRQRREGTAA